MANALSNMRLFVVALVAAGVALASLPVQAGEFTDALVSAYETNPRIKAQRKILEQSDERVSQALAGFRPSANASYQRGRQQTSFDGSGKTTSDLENKTLTVTQPLFLGGRNFFNYAGSKDRMKANREYLQALEQEVLLDAIVAYMDVIQNYEVLELSRNNVGVLDKQLQASRDRFSVGDVTRTDVAQSDARFARSRSDSIQAQGDLESALAQFERVIGYRPENLPLPLPQAFPPLPKTLEAAIEKALEDNPNVEAAYFSKEAAKEDSNVALSRILPQVSLQGQMSRQDGAGVLGTSQYDTDQVLVNVDIPIYQNGSEYSQVREADLLAKQRKYELLNTRQQTREALIMAWENLQTAIATIESQEQQMEASQLALDGVRQEHQYGARTVLDVLDAEQELFISQVDLVRAQRNRYVSLFNLLLILGDLNMSTLNIDVPQYDPKEHYDDVKWQLIGF